MLVDFTFKNELIKKYFQGDNSYVPISELIYLHEHPLIKESFLVELERKINRAAEVMAARNLQGKVVNRFIESTMNLGALLPKVDQESAPKILD